MFAFDRLDAQRIAMSAAGALLFSAICVGSAIIPAQAASAATPLAGWQAAASTRLDRKIAALPEEDRLRAVRDAKIGLALSPDGHVGAPTLLQSSGDHKVDMILLRRAGQLRLAPVPAAARGPAKTIELRIALVEGRQAPVPAETIRYAAR